MLGNQKSKGNPPLITKNHPNLKGQIPKTSKSEPKILKKKASDSKITQIKKPPSPEQRNTEIIKNLPSNATHVKKSSKEEAKTIPLNKISSVKTGLPPLNSKKASEPCIQIRNSPCLKNNEEHDEKDQIIEELQKEIGRLKKEIKYDDKKTALLIEINQDLEKKNDEYREKYENIKTSEDALQLKINALEFKLKRTNEKTSQ